MSESAARLRRIRELFDAVIDLPASERSMRLHALVPDDESLCTEVEALLRDADVTRPDFIAPFARTAADSGSSLVGQRLGHYNVVRLVGAGGMGAVYEAVRSDDQYQKRVAIKIVRRGLDAELTLARFRRERQILANLEHPHIATLLDGGVTQDGMPFLVMEFVDGAPITYWCDERRASIRQRLELFRQICSAVQYAHKRLVVHRDLKPGNILVTSDGTVKLLDFGIAKLLDEEINDTNLPLTRGGARAFTPEYASPEQIRGDTLTTASDVYSLGIILFELLAGRRPHLTSGKSLVEIERLVLDQEIPRPSSVLGAESAVRAGERDVGRLQKRLSGELDNIVLTASHTEPARRYATVEALDDDLRRYLTGLPVRAQGDWAGYRALKFVRRNTAAVAAAVLVVVAIIGGAITTTIQARRAQSEQRRQEAVNAFLLDLMRSVHPETGQKDVAVSEVLDSAAQRLDRDLAAQPEVRAELETVIGQSYQGLGRYPEAETHLTRALLLQQELQGTQSDQYIIALSNLGQLNMAQGLLDSAEKKFHQALQLRKESSHTETELDASLLSNLGSLAHNRGQPDSAEVYHRLTLGIQRRVLGDTADVTAQSINDVAVAVGEQGRLEEAESLSRVAVSILRHNHPEGNAMVAGALNGLAGALDFQGKTAAAESAYVETIAMRKRVLGPRHPDYAFTLFNYSMFILDQQRYEEAARYAREILALRGTVIPESHSSIAAALQTLGRSLDKTGDSRAGEAALIESLELRRKYVGDNSWPTASSQGVLGEHYTLTKEFARAEALLLGAQEKFIKLLGIDNQRTQTNTRRIIALYKAWGKPAKVQEYEKMLPVKKD